MIEPIVDVSHWQGNIDEYVMLSKNILGLIIRIGSIDKTTGECYTDYLFEENVSKFYGEVPIGGYWYFRPNFDGIKQAKYVIERAKEIKSDFGAEFHLPINVDVENNDAKMSPAFFGKRLDDFLYTLLNADYFVGIYTRGYFWNDNVGTNSRLASSLPLNVARYNNSITHPWENDSYSPLRPTSWTNWDLWQWSADGNGLGKFYGCMSSAVDLNRGNFSSVSAYHKWINWKQEQSESKLCGIIRAIKDLCNRVLRENCGET